MVFKTWGMTKDENIGKHTHTHTHTHICIYISVVGFYRCIKIYWKISVDILMKKNYKMKINQNLWKCLEKL